MRLSLPALFLTAATSLSAQGQSQVKGVYTPGQMTPHQQLTRDIYKQLIEIKTGVSTGNITDAAVAIAQRFKEAGIPESDIFVGGPLPNKHNVVARFRGKAGSTRKPLILLAHLDVVEALKADWSPEFDPFVFTEKDGYWYGRGTADDKAMAAIFVANVYRLKQEGFQPDRDIIVALTADEEGGGSNGVSWLLQNHKELVDGGLVINFRMQGVPAFGVSGLFSDPAVDARAHGRDERMRMQSFFEGQEFLYRLTKALASPPTATPNGHNSDPQ